MKRLVMHVLAGTTLFLVTWFWMTLLCAWVQYGPITTASLSAAGESTAWGLLAIGAIYCTCALLAWFRDGGAA